MIKKGKKRQQQARKLAQPAVAPAPSATAERVRYFRALVAPAVDLALKRDSLLRPSFLQTGSREYSIILARKQSALFLSVNSIHNYINYGES